MFHPPQAAIGLALLPLAWAADERARAERGFAGGSAARERDADLARYFPPGWARDTVPDWPVAVTSRSGGAEAAAAQGGREGGQGSRLNVLWHSAVRRVKGLVPRFSRS